MKKYLIALLPFIFSACGTMQGSMQDSQYTAPGNEMTVKVPPIPLVTARDGQEEAFHYVEFSPDKGYWMMNAAYYLEWFKLKKEPSDKLLMLVKEQVQTVTFKKAGGEINQIDCHFTTIHATRAYECQGKGTLSQIPAGVFATSFVLQGRLVNAYMVYPLEGTAKELPGLRNNYNKLMNSVRFMN